MVPDPTAFGLTLCKEIIIEEGTRSLTLVNTFRKIVADVFPSPPQTFWVVAALTDGIGSGTIQVKVHRLDDNNDIYSRDKPIHFPNRLSEIQVSVRVRECIFPSPGKYQVMLLVDRALIAQRYLHVQKREVPS